MRRAIMKKSILAVVGGIAVAQAVIAGSAAAAGRGNGEPLGVIYVESQGLYYDTFATTTLKPRGRFQPLYPTGGPAGGPSTPYGPGDNGYVGGRWWIDTNGDGEMDDMDTFFSCPLLGPGRSEP
jgi:hypothetical protein